MLRRLPPISECQQIEWNINSICSDAEIAHNVMRALETGFPEFCEQEPPNDRVVSICGSAPSLADTCKDITGDVWACNDAGWKLLDEGVVPKYWMIWDPQSPPAPGSPYYCLRKLHKDTTYLVASMCSPAVFERLRDYNVIIWHPYLGDMIPMEAWLAGWESPCRQLVGFDIEVPGYDAGVGRGTSAAVTRSCQFAPLMGYRTLHLHGADSSCKEGLIHFEDLESDRNGAQQLFSVWVGTTDLPLSRKPFVTTGQMYRQLEEFIPLVKSLMAEGVTVKVHGSGAIPWLAMLKGWHVNNV